MLSVEKKNDLSAAFEKKFSSTKPTTFVVAPGRVNIIGEHVDYMGFAVLPCALNHSTNIATAYSVSDSASDTKPSTTTPYLTLAHVDSTQFPGAVYKTALDIKYDPSAMASSPHKWTGYVVSAYLGLIEYLAGNKNMSAVGTTLDPKVGTTATVLDTVRSLHTAAPLPTGMTLLVDGDIPMASGVSSSSSLVVAALMSFAKAFGVDLTPRETAELCANAERHVGTAGGGMDQAAICMSKKGGAQLISFDPLGARDVMLPECARLVVSNTLKAAPKAESAATHYNCRVFECRVGILLITKALGIKADLSDPRTLTLRSLQESQTLTLQQLEALIKKHLRDTPYTLSEIEFALGHETLNALYKSSIGASVAVRNTSFEPYRRCLHVVQETQRVDRFVEATTNASASSENASNQEKILQDLGSLMDSSDESLNCFFDCSANEIVRMTRLARAAGAYGSRLTGAGWGGCCVSLVHKDKVSAFIKQMSKEYYNTETVNHSWIFAVDPAAGASIQ
eukprot:Lankesteria_metandrocarpae@DN6063_c0_g1_i1.p1